MLLLYPVWATLAAVCFGNGALIWSIAVRVAPRRFLAVPSAGQVFWLGCAFFIAELQLASLVHRLDHHVWLWLTVIAITGAASSRPLWPHVRRALRRSRPGVWCARAVILAVLGYLIGLGSSQPVTLYDTVSTHLQQAKWAAAFPAVPGLGNLNPKLGFDQAHHLIAAISDGWYWKDCGAYVPNGFLLLSTLVQWVFVLTADVRTDELVYGKIFAALTIPFLATRVLASSQLSSLTGDLAMAAVMLPCALQLMSAPRGGGAHRRRTSLTLLTAASLGAAIFAIKFNGIPMFVVAIGAFAWLMVRGPRESWWRMCIIGAPPALLIGGTIARRVVLTGWPLFPIPYGALPLPWTVPYERTLDQYLWIKSWARLPGVSATEVLSGEFWTWFRPWAAAFRASHEWMIFTWASAALVLLIALPRDRSGRGTPWSMLVVVGSLLGIAYWFLGAPDMRFGAAYFWVFFASAWTPLLAREYRTSATARILVAIAAIGITSWRGGGDVIPQGPANWTELPVLPIPPTAERRIDQGTPYELILRIPTAGSDRCGNVPLPCTHYEHIQRLRVPRRLRDGFIPVP